LRLLAVQRSAKICSEINEVQKQIENGYPNRW
jgi:hypothetical protein